MMVVLFEGRARKREDYFDLAAALLPEVQGIDGFISVERFQSFADPQKILSLSTWRDEEALARWRAHEGHRAAQARGRADIFADYRLRIASVVRDYSRDDRREAPSLSTLR